MKKMVLVILIVIFGSVGIVYGQSSKDAYKAIKKLEIRISTGVSYRDYPGVLTDAKTEVDLFLSSKASKKNPEFSEHLKKAMTHYEMAMEIWKLQFASGRSDEMIRLNTEAGKIIQKLYPKAEIKRYEGSPPVAGINFPPYQYYWIPDVLRGMWTDASKEVNLAAKYLQE